jgi:deoxyhypusine synthase
MSSESKIVSP